MATTYWVSNTATGPWIVGSDSNNGLAQGTAFLTFGKALSTATNGDTIMVGPGTYTAPATSYVISIGCIVIGAGIDVTILKGVSGANRGQIVGFATGANNYSWMDLTIDANTGAGTETNHGVSDANTTLHIGLFTRVKCINFLQYGWQSQTANTRIQAALTDCETNCTGSTTNRGSIFFNALVQGAIAITGGTYVLTKQNVPSVGQIFVKGTAANAVTFSMIGATCSMTLDSSLAGAGIHEIVNIKNVANALVERNTLTCTNAPGSRTAFFVHISADTTTPLDSSGGIARYNTINNSSNGGIGIIIGEDGASNADNYSDNGRIYYNFVLGSAAAEVAMHGVMFGFNGGGIGYGNWIYRTNVSLVVKETRAGTLTIMHSNVIRGTTDAALITKGSNGARFYRNTVHQPAGYTGGTGGLLSAVQNSVTGHDCDDLEFSDNSIYCEATPQKYTGSASGTTNMTHTRNNYRCTVAEPAAPWSKGASTYASIGLWRAGQEATATAFDPCMVDAANGNYHLRPHSPLRRAGGALSGVSAGDYDGKAWGTPPSVGAFQGPNPIPAALMSRCLTDMMHMGIAA